MTQSIKKITLIVIGIMAFVSLSIQAQGTVSISRTGYYIAPDTDGIQQVFQLVLGEEQNTRQITYSATDVLNYGIAYDALSIAYISDGQLWLQPIHTDEPESLTAVSASEYLHNPVFSPDSQYIAYTDNGVWLLDLDTRETRQLLENIPFTTESESVGELRIYSPKQFIWSANGSVAQLVVEIGMWEWATAGIVDLTSGELQIIEEVTYTDILPLYGNRVLIYGNNAMNGNPVLRVAVDDNDINTYDEVLDFTGLLDNVITLFADQAIEIAPGTVRVLGTVMSNEPDSGAFYFDYNLMSNEVLGVSTFTLPTSESSPVNYGTLSSDGALLSMYVEFAWTETGHTFGNLRIADVVTGEEVFALDGHISDFQWQP